MVEQGVGLPGSEDAASSRYRYDRTYFVSGKITQDELLGAMVDLLQGAGWRIEDAPKSNNENLQPSLSSGVFKSASFAKDGVRVLILVPLPLQLNPQAPVGADYFVHFEEE